MKKITINVITASVILFALTLRYPERLNSAAIESEIYNVYVGQHPKARKIDWSDEAQGIAHDRDHWHITQKGSLWKIPVSVDLANARRNTPGVKVIDLKNIPALHGYDHFGDFEHYEFKGQGYLLIPITGKQKPPVIAAFESISLNYISHAYSGLNDAPWCAIDSQGTLYTSVSKNSLLLRFGVDWEALRNYRKLNLRSLASIPLQDESGKGVFIDTPQGGAISASGNLLYLVAGYYKDSHPSWGIHIFDLRTGRRILRSRSGVGPFNYEFHPGLPKYEEPEGMTIWDLDDRRAPGIAGKLHVLMLDNDPKQDDIYLKHYTNNDAYPVLYENVNFDGRALPLRAGMQLRNLGIHDFNDKASSVWVPNGWTVEMYEHAQFKGALLRKTTPIPNLRTEGWGDKISSVRIFPPSR